MSAYLLDHPPRRSQYRVGRRATPTGTQVLHSFEIAPDLHGPDMGAEKGASIIRNRTDAAGSYHLLGDRDSEILLVPLEWEAFHDGTGSNPWSIGLSLAVTAAWFRAAPDTEKLWYMARLATMARRASNWLKANHGIETPARRLTRTSQREAGFCTHMDRETWKGRRGRRTDPWGDSDDMWHLFLTLYEDTANHPQEGLMPELAIIDAFADWLDRPPSDEELANHVAYAAFHGMKAAVLNIARSDEAKGRRPA
jgi:hypothetical protein